MSDGSSRIDEKEKPGSGAAVPAKSQEQLRKQQGRFCSQITVIK